MKQREIERRKKKQCGLLWWYCRSLLAPGESLLYIPFSHFGTILLELYDKDRFTYMAVPLVLVYVIIRTWLLGILLDLEIEG